MSRRPVRFLSYALVAAAAWLASGPAPTTAQNPPAGDPEKRLQALEQKLDRLLAKIDPQPKAVPSADEFRKQLDLMNQARDTLVNRLEREEQSYAAFRRENPVLSFRGQPGNPYGVRMQKIEAERVECSRRLRELAVQIATVEKTLKSGDDQVPTLLLLKRRGIDLARLPGVAETDAAGQLRAYLRSLQLEADEQATLVKALDTDLEAARKSVEHMASFEVEEDRYKARLASTRQLLEAIIKRMNELNLVKDTIQ